MSRSGGLHLSPLVPFDGVLVAGELLGFEGFGCCFPLGLHCLFPCGSCL